MIIRGQTPNDPASLRSSGPQGTQLFSTEELRHYASDMAPDGRATVREPVLEGVGSSLQGRRFTLRSGRQTIGRQRDNNIVIDDLSVSASHAWIMNQQGRYAIMNTLSTNGTFVNDVRIHESPLRHGDRVRFGQAEFVFLTRELDDAGPARTRWIVAVVLALGGLAAVGWWLH